ncbi:MAG: Flp pilus assembly protein CpaB [Chloroflexota bacterium]|nr:Flp pilus assembly protein CpaB [Chloroflexota bacterium]
MKARGGRFLLILGGGLAVMAFVVVYIFMSKAANANQAAAVPTPVPLQNMVVVTHYVPAFTKIDASDLKVMQVDASTVKPGAATSIGDVADKVTKVNIQSGDSVQTAALAQTGFSNVLAKGERAFSLAVPERSTFGNAITENDRVDVLWTASYKVSVKWPGANNTPTNEMGVLTATKTLLQDIKVLRVINLRTPPPPAKGQSGGTDTSTSDTASPAAARTGAATGTAPTDMYNDGAPYQEVLVLAVSDQQAEVLQFARENGTVDLTMRSSAPMKDAGGKDIVGPDKKTILGDHDADKTTGVTMSTLIEKYGMPAPAANQSPLP